MRKKATLKDRPRSTEKHFIENNLLTLGKGSVPKYYSPVKKVNNVVSENLSFIKYAETKSQSKLNSFIDNSPRKTDRSQPNNDCHSSLINKIFKPRDDNQTPEGDMITLMHYLLDTGATKEIGNTSMVSKGNCILGDNITLASEV